MSFRARFLMPLSILLTLAVACCGSHSDGAKPTLPEVRFLPSPLRPCLSIPPPAHPTLLPSCPSAAIASCPNDDVNTATLLDYLDHLDRWANDYAWPICKDVKP